METALHGNCACGRNQYIIRIPDDSPELAQVVFDNSSHSRRLQASPLTAFIKVPVSWFQSSTIAFDPDETHQSIRRTFTSPFRSNLRHQFCGYCGTQLSQWDDSSRDQDRFIWLTLGSLRDEDLEILEDLGLSDGESEPEQVNAGREYEESSSRSVLMPPQGAAHRGAPWFESLVEDTKLGKIKRQRGGQVSADGSSRVEWEVFEWTSNDDKGASAKRKIEDVDMGDHRDS